MEEEIYVLISAVLRILDTNDLPATEPVANAAEPFATLLASAGPAPGLSSSLSEIRQDSMEALNRVQPLAPKDRAAIFSVERRSYDSFVRALEEARKPLGAHALDLFQ